MKTTYRNTFPDMLALMWSHYIRLFMMQAIALAFLGITSLSTWKAIPPECSMLLKITLLVLTEAVLFVIYMLIVCGLTVLSALSRMNKTFLTEHTITIDESGLVEENGFSRGEYRWDGILKFVKTRRHLFVYVAQHSAHAIPRRAFASESEWQQFVEKMREFKQRASLPQKCEPAGMPAGTIGNGAHADDRNS